MERVNKGIAFLICIPNLLMGSVFPGDSEKVGCFNNDSFQEDNSLSKIQAIRFYENTAGQYVDTMFIYSLSDIYSLPLSPDVLFRYSAGYSRQQLLRKMADNLLRMTSIYLDRIQHHEMPRSLEVETILVDRILRLKDQFDQKILEKANNYLSKEFNVKIKYYSDEEQAWLIDSEFDTLIFPSGHMEGLSAYPISPVQSYSNDQINFLYEQGLFYSSEYMLFLQRMKRSDLFFHVCEYYARKLNMVLFKEWFSENFSSGSFTPVHWRFFYRLFH